MQLTKTYSTTRRINPAINELLIEQRISILVPDRVRYAPGMNFYSNPRDPEDSVLFDFESQHSYPMEREMLK